MNDPLLISSRANPRFKALRALADDPRRHGQAVLDGVHLVASCLASGMAIRQVLVSESGQRNPEIRALRRQVTAGDHLILRDALFREISGVSTPTGIAAVIDIPSPPVAEVTGDALLLDGVQDAGNVGALLRTAAAAGVTDVLLGAGCAGAWTSRVLRAAQGAHFALVIREHVDLLAVLARGSGTSIATVAGGGENVHQLDLTGPILWLVGNEGAGLSAPLVAAADVRATIPLASGTESLNVGAAAAICLFEARRQRCIHKEYLPRSEPET